jgi:hypothetical protein
MHFGRPGGARHPSATTAVFIVGAYIWGTRHGTKRCSDDGSTVAGVHGGDTDRDPVRSRLEGTGQGAGDVSDADPDDVDAWMYAMYIRFKQFNREVRREAQDMAKMYEVVTADLSAAERGLVAHDLHGILESLKATVEELARKVGDD